MCLGPSVQPASASVEAHSPQKLSCMHGVYIIYNAVPPFEDFDGIMMLIPRVCVV